MIVLTETWVSSKLDSRELFSCQNDYTVYRQDRCGRLGVGTLIAVADNIVSTFCEDLFDCLNNVVVRFPKAPLFLLGDFNFPGISWKDCCPIVTSGSSECSAFIITCSMFNRSQLVNVPTRVTSSSANVLDLVLTTTPKSVSSLSLLPGLSDHSVIHFTLQSSSPRLPRQYKLIRDYGKADFRAINAELAIFADAFFPQF